MGSANHSGRPVPKSPDFVGVVVGVVVISLDSSCVGVEEWNVIARGMAQRGIPREELTMAFLAMAVDAALSIATMIQVKMRKVSVQSIRSI